MSWADWRDEIAKACDGSHWTIEGIEQQIALGRLVILEPRDCCLLVELIDYPGGRTCQVMWSAGNLPALYAAAADVEAWARIRGCNEMLIESREAVGRALRKVGYEPWSVTMRKPLHGRIH